MKALIFPFMILNFFSGIVGGVWLTMLGYWNVVILGVLLIMGGTMIISILLLPSMLLMAPFLVSDRITSSKAIMIPISLISLSYTYFVMGIWAIGIFSQFAGLVDWNARLPMVLWSYSTATAVWGYMAQKEAQSGNEYSSLSAFFNQIGCVALMIYTSSNFRVIDIYEMAIWFAVPMIIGMFIQIGFLLSATNEQI